MRDNATAAPRTYGQWLDDHGYRRATICAWTPAARVTDTGRCRLVSGWVAERSRWYAATISTDQSATELNAMEPASGLWLYAHLCGRPCCCLRGRVAAHFDPRWVDGDYTPPARN